MKKIDSFYDNRIIYKPWGHDLPGIATIVNGNIDEKI